MFLNPFNSFSSNILVSYFCVAVEAKLNDVTAQILFIITICVAWAKIKNSVALIADICLHNIWVVRVDEK